MTADQARAQAELAQVTEIANRALGLWDLPQSARAEPMNLSENVTLLVSAPDGTRSVLRVHRPGYHSRRAIECELAWLDALRRDADVETPRVIPGRDGCAIQQAQFATDPRFLVLFEFIEGEEPSAEGDLIGNFATLGALAARCHLHALGWQRPRGFERLVWDTGAVFGPEAIWGDWRAAPGVDLGVQRVLKQVERQICARLEAYGRAPGRFNLIHGDMRLANLLVSPMGTRLIDFDDCGFGWLMYDFAAAVSFIEEDPRMPELKSAWLEGYQRHRPLQQPDLDAMDTLVMLRRMALLAWIGSHIEAPEPQALAPHFAAGTATLGEAWLSNRRI